MSPERLKALREAGRSAPVEPRKTPDQTLGYRVIGGTTYRVLDLDSHGEGSSIRMVPGDNGNGTLTSKVRKVI